MFAVCLRTEIFDKRNFECNGILKKIWETFGKKEKIKYRLYYDLFSLDLFY